MGLLKFPKVMLSSVTRKELGHLVEESYLVFIDLVLT